MGEGLRRSGVPREKVFLESKVWVSDYGYEETLHAFDKSAGKLGVDTIDLFILHQPLPNYFDRTIAAYHALEKLLSDGKVRAIGVSNFTPAHLDTLRSRTRVVPAVNQVELHPYFADPELQRANERLGVLTQAWSPIGGITFYPGWGDGKRNVMEDPTINEIATAHDKSPAQVMLRWGIQEGRSVIPKSVNPERIRENFEVFDFELNNEEMQRIGTLDTGVRGGPDPTKPRDELLELVIDEA